MWSSLTAHQVPPTPEQPPAAGGGGGVGGGADDSFYGTLDLGHEAQINNDLVRAIRTEIVEIESAINVASTNVRNEERSFAQLTKNNEHSRGEMFDYRRDAAEVLDSEIMTEDLRSGFKDQFAAMVAPHVVSPSSSAHDDDHNDVATDEGGSPARGGAPPGTSTRSKKPRAFSHKRYIDRKRDEAKDKSVSIRSIQQEIRETRKKIRAADDETASYVQDVRARQLDRVKTEGERQVEARRREREAEGQRNRGVKEALQVARSNAGAFAQNIAEKAKEQISERSAHLSREIAMKSLNDAKQQELALLQAEERNLDEELAALSGQLDFLTGQAVEFEAEQKRSSDMNVELGELKLEIADLESTKEEKSKEADASKADLESAMKAFEEASEELADANAEKLENDRATEEVLEPAAARKADAVKEKQKLAGEIVEIQKSIERAQSDSKEAAARSAAKVVAKSDELKEQKAKLERASSDLEALKKDDESALVALSNELDEVKEYATKFEAATQAERDRLELLRNERTEARIAHLEKRKSDLGAIEDARRGDVDNLRELRAYLGEMREKRVAIEEAEIILDENGDEVEAKSDDGGYDDRDDMVNEAAGSPAVQRG